MLLLNNMANFRVFLCQFWDWVNNDKYFVYLHIILHLHVFEIIWTFIFSILNHLYVSQYLKHYVKILIYQLIIFYFILKALQVIQLQVTFKIALQIYNTLNFLFKRIISLSCSMSRQFTEMGGSTMNCIAKNSDIYSFKLPRTVMPYNFRVVKTVKNKVYVAMICCRELNADLILQLCTAVNALYLHIMVSAYTW